MSHPVSVWARPPGQCSVDAGSVDALWISSLCFLPEMREEKAVGQEALENKASGAQLQVGNAVTVRSPLSVALWAGTLRAAPWAELPPKCCCCKGALRKGRLSWGCWKPSSLSWCLSTP